MNEFRKYITLIEAQSQAYRVKLPYKLSDLSPVISEDSLSLHYNKLLKNYVDKVNSGETDDFFVAGVQLHNKYFEQLMPPSGKSPNNRIKDFINAHFDSFDNFKKEFKEVAMSLHGSGWCYLSNTGKIKIIKNHETKNDILVLVDMWEHAYLLDYESNKEKYLDNIWKLINWDFINSRME